MPLCADTQITAISAARRRVDIEQLLTLGRESPVSLNSRVTGHNDDDRRRQMTSDRRDAMVTVTRARIAGLRPTARDATARTRANNRRRRTSSCIPLMQCEARRSEAIRDESSRDMQRREEMGRVERPKSCCSPTNCTSPSDDRLTTIVKSTQLDCRRQTTIKRVET